MVRPKAPRNYWVINQGYYFNKNKPNPSECVKDKHKGEMYACGDQLFL